MSRRPDAPWKNFRRTTQLSQKPSNLLYGVDEKPPLRTIILLGLQHVSVFFISIVFPVIIVQSLGDSISPENGRAFISLSFIAAAVTTMLQAVKRNAFGSGYLCPAVCGPSYMDATRAAAAAGGLPLIFGMTALAGLIEMLFSRVLHKLRILFPAEVSGVAVTMVGVVIIPVAVRNLFAVNADNAMGTPTEVTIGLVTLALMMGLNVFGKGGLKLYCALIGITVGYVVALAAGVIPNSDLQKFSAVSFFDVPYIRDFHWAFDFSLIIPFMVATICSTLKSIGDLVICQKVNDANWRLPDMNSISKGILVDGFGGVLPGVMGGFGQSTSSTHIGLSLATGVTSRIIAFSYGIILITLAFLPKVSMIFLVMPRPVMGAALLFAATFMIVSGLQIITSRMLDARKIMVVGVSLALGLSVDMVPGLYSHVHPWALPVFRSSLALAILSALILNLIMRIGLSQKRQIELTAAPQSRQILFDFIDESGRTWGALTSVIEKVKNAVLEFNEALICAGIPGTPVRYVMIYNELSINVNIYYKGPLLSVAKPDSIDWMTADDSAFSSMALSMVYYQTDEVHVSHHQDENHYCLHFDH